MQLVKDLSGEDGCWILLELFAGSANLTARAHRRAQWRALPPVDLLNEGLRKKIKTMIAEEQPDLVTLAPPCGLCLDREALWERQREHLPFWKFAKEVWDIQYKEGRLALVEQPVRSQALELNYMLERKGGPQSSGCSVRLWIEGSCE